MSALAASARHLPSAIRDDWLRYLEVTVLDMWRRPTLTPRDRSFATVAAVATLRCDDELRTQALLALDHGISEAELCETMLQVSGYAGLAVGVAGMRVLRHVLDGPVADDPWVPADVDYTATDDSLERARAVMETLWPDRSGPAPPPPEIAPDWRVWLRRTAFGELWARPGLSLAERERITLAVVAALGRVDHLRSHVLSAANLGVPPEQIGEQLMHLAVYIGFPAVDAIAAAEAVLGEQTENQD